jgi:DNA repair protein RecN (Recombination protein N)
VIEELSIRDLGVIGEAPLPLGPGFTALTGETGAGKTMIVTALGLLLGERADSQVLRKDSAAAVVEGHWLIDAGGPVASRVADAGGSWTPPAPAAQRSSSAARSPRKAAAAPSSAGERPRWAY